MYIQRLCTLFKKVFLDDNRHISCSLIVDTQYQFKLDQWGGTSQFESSDYGSDVLTGFESEMFRNTTSKTTNKTLPVAGRTRNVRTRRGKMSKVPRKSLSRRIRPAKNSPKGKQRSNFREQYLHIMGTQRAANDHALLDGITAFF